MTCSKSCHAKNKLFHVSCKKNKLFHMSCKKTSCSTCHAKTMQKPCKTVQKTSCSTCCKNHAKTMQNEPSQSPASAICAIWVSQGKPLNIHSPPGPCYMCYMCYMGLTRQATEHPLSPGSLLYVLYVQIGPIAHILQIFARCAIYIVHIARSWGRVGVQRLGV